jgi:hypothetical protein
MTKCKYFDCGWCYAPDDVKTNATQSGCFEPEHCPYLKSQNQMTETDISKVLIEGDTATIMGVKYQRIIEPEPQTLKELFRIYVEYGNWAQSKEVIAQELVNIVKEFIPEPVTYDGEEYQLGWNDAIQTLKDKLR